MNIKNQCTTKKTNNSTGGGPFDTLTVKTIISFSHRISEHTDT